MTAKLAERLLAGDLRALARGISLVEDDSPAAQALLSACFPHTGKAIRIGVTGAPGAGKSTLVDQLARVFREQQQRVGILAVDPTSPFSGGAILGDRIRMERHHADAGVYARSMATRGAMGGLARAAMDTTMLIEASGRDRVLIETVGVGQDEIDIVRLADITLVVLVPGMGDDVQNLKAGVMEIADIFVLNKADREGADRFEQQLRAVLQIVPERDGWKPPIVLTIATENKGIDDLARQIERFREHFAKQQSRASRLNALWRERIINLLREQMTRSALEKFAKDGSLEQLAAEVAERRTDPYSAVAKILQKTGTGGTR